jgi:hypothetical protein
MFLWRSESRILSLLQHFLPRDPDHKCLSCYHCGTYRNGNDVSYIPTGKYRKISLQINLEPQHSTKPAARSGQCTALQCRNYTLPRDQTPVNAQEKNPMRCSGESVQIWTVIRGMLVTAPGTKDRSIERECAVTPYRYHLPTSSHRGLVSSVQGNRYR